MNWQTQLAEQTKKREERRLQARQKTEGRRKQQSAFVKAFLPRLAESLRGAAETYNQAAAEEAKVDGPRKADAGDTVDLAINKQGFRFEDSGKGFIRVYRVSGDQMGSYAYLQPVLNRAGDLVGWQEKQIFPGGKTRGHRLDTLTEQYLITTVKNRLLTTA
jgi:hypothetical protein